LTQIRVMVVDDHPMLRFGISALVDAEADMSVVGEASDGEEAIRIAAETKPDVILMDVVMPGMDGIEATRRIVKAQPDVAILMLTVLDDDSVFEAMRAGARGYQCKVATGKETLRAIRAIAEGEAIFSPGAAYKLLNYFKPEPVSDPASFPQLTDRERDILNLIARGYPNQEIANRLDLSPKTVRNRVSIILSKLHVKTRYEAMVQAQKAGLG